MYNFSDEYVIMVILPVQRKGRDQSKDGGSEKGDHHDTEWREVAWSADDHNSFRLASSRPHDQEVVVGLLGDCS